MGKYINTRTEKAELTPFKRCCLENFPFIEADFDALTNYELYCKIVEYLNMVIDQVNINTTNTQEFINKFNELKAYVDNYFANLDVQEEINNKLDQMATDGTLTDIIAQYLKLAGVLAYDTVTEMKTADNLENGSICKTLGYNNYNDGKGEFYKVRNITTEDVIDEINIIKINNSDVLVAELIKRTPYNNSLMRLKHYYINDTNIYITELHNVESYEVIPTGGNPSDPKSGATNLNDFNSEDYDFVINASLFDMDTNEPIGYTVMNGIGYDTSLISPTTNTTGFINNELHSIPINDVSSSAELINLGYKDAFCSFRALINDGIDTDFNELTDLGQFIGQLDDNTFISIFTDGRKLFNKGFDYNNLRSFIRSLYPNIRILVSTDGGGSSQTYSHNKSLLPILYEGNLGRIVPTVLAIKLKGVDK